MTRVFKTAAILVLAAIAAAPALADPNDDMLGAARKLVEEKKYDQAIEEYKKIDTWLRHDPGLVIEFARVYSYADMHSEAIRLFEEVRATHPERETEMLRELGDQYKWSGDLEKAIEVYEKALKNGSNDPDVTKGLAEAVAWRDKRAEDKAKYNEVINKTPSPMGINPKTSDDVLAYARKLVEEKKYDQAINEYSKISDWLRHDPGLVIESARVYTYADMHPEAIKLFEEVRATHPDREAEILKELGDQYKWNGQLKESIAAYEKALQNNPNDIAAEVGLAEALAWSNRHKEAVARYDDALEKDPRSVQALIAKADVLSWMDSLEEAYKVYGKALEVDPGNTRALNGQAKVRVWQGYHKEGAARYREILKEHPDEVDAMEGLAYALHWDGRDYQSSATASRVVAIAPHRQASRELLFNIKGAQGPYAQNYDGYWEDKNKLSVETHGMRTGIHPDGLTTVEGIYEWQKSRQKNYYASKANRGGAGIRRRLTDDLELSSYLYGTNFGHVDYNVFTTDTWLTYWMGDMFRFDGSFNRGTFTDVGSILNKIVVNTGSVSGDFRPNRFLFLSGKFSRGFYSDTNMQNTFLGKVEHRITTKPFYSKFYYNYYYSGWSKNMNHGYFNPRKIDSHAWGIYASKDLTKRLFVEAQGSVGYEYQTPKAYHPTYFMGMNVNYRIADNWIASLGGELFRAYTDPNSNGYSKVGMMFSITYKMGAGEPEQAEFARSASRPMTGS